MPLNVVQKYKKNRVIKDEKCGDGILYVHSFVLFMRSTPWQNAITEHNMC